MRSFLLSALLIALAIPSPAQEPGSEASRRPLPQGVKVERDIEYVPGGGRSRSLDLYQPEKSDGPLPLVVWIHGGAWLAGSKDNNQAIPLVPSGFVTASINYRLSKEATFPAQIEDCKAAIRFLRANAQKYGIDPDRIGVWGSSAGGHLVALLGTANEVKDWEDVGEHPAVSSRVQAVCDFYGPANLLTMGKQSGPESQVNHDAPDSPEARLLGGPVQENAEKAKLASPITYVSSDDPPFLIVHGDKDPVVPVAQSREFHEALKAAGVNSTLHIVEGGGHGNGFNYREIGPMVRDFFVKHLRSGSEKKR